MANLNEFIGALREGGTRGNQFQVTITGAPGDVQSVLGQDFVFLCKATTVPALNIGEVMIPYRGRQIFVAGDRTYDPWTVTIWSDRDQRMKAGFEIWQNHLGDIGVVTDRSAVGQVPSMYYAQASIQQMDRNDNVLRSYYLYDVWPQNVAGTDMAYDANDILLEFAVTLRFNYMTIGGKGSGRASGRTVAGPPQGPH